MKYFGGYGFDYYALLYGFGGGLIGLLLDLIAPPHIRGSGYGDDDEHNEDDYEEIDENALEW